MRRCDRTRPRRLTRLLGAAALPLLLVACSMISPDRPHEELTLKTIRVAAPKTIDTVPLRMAVHDGLFRRAGLEVELVEQPDQRDAMAALESGEAEVAFARNITLLKAARNGAKLEVQCEAYISGPNTMGLVTLPGGGYDEPTQDPDPTIALEPNDDLGKLTTRSRLATEGIDPERIRFTTKSFDGMFEALRDGTIDAAWMTEPHISRAQREFGAKIVTDTARGAMLDFPMSSYAADKKVVAEHPASFARFRDLLAEAQQLATDPSTVRAALSRFTSLDRTTATLVAIGTFPTSVNSVRLQRVADLMHRSGLVEARIDVNDLVPAPSRPRS